jgi:hypothetical protein
MSPRAIVAPDNALFALPATSLRAMSRKRALESIIATRPSAGHDPTAAQLAVPGPAPISVRLVGSKAQRACTSSSTAATAA